MPSRAIAGRPQPVAAGVNDRGASHRGSVVIRSILLLSLLAGCRTPSHSRSNAKNSAGVAAAEESDRVSESALASKDASLSMAESTNIIRLAGASQLVSEPSQTAETLPDPMADDYEVTLNQAVFASLNGHPVIGAEIERIQQSKADYLTSSLFPNPELFTDVQLLPLTHPFTVNRQGGPPQQDLVLTYPIDWFLFGKRTAAMSSAHYGVHVAQAEFENLIRLRVVETATAFFDAVEARGLHDVARQNVENLRRLESVTKQAIADGGRPAIEASRVRLDLIAAEQRFRTAKAAERTAIARLRALMGDQGIPFNLIPVSELDRQLLSPLVDVDQSLVVAQQSRPDLQAIQWRMTKAGADIVVEQRAARPSIAPSLGYAHQYQEKAIGFPDANSWSAALTMSVPIYNRNQGNIEKATAEERRTQFQRSAALLNLEAEIRQAVAELEAADENAKSVATEQLQLAESVRDSITTAYENGGRPLIDVLDAQRNYRETYSLYISTRAAYSRALYRYYAAVGQRLNADE